MRVLVVGAGLSGLTAAYRLSQAGIAVSVLEARERIGGRAWRIPVGEEELDAGCEVLDDAHEALLALAREVGIEVLRGEPWPHLVHEGLAGLEEAIAATARRVDPGHPEELAGADALDRQTLGGWLREHGADADVLAAAELVYAVASSTVSIEHMSLLAYAAKLAAGAAPNGLRLRLEGGPSALAERLAEGLDVRIASEAVAIEQDAGGARVRLRDGAEEYADRVVLAVPLTLERELGFDPPLPPDRRVAHERARYGQAVKAGFVCDEPPALGLTEAGVVYRPDRARPLYALFAGAGAARHAGPPAGARATALVDWSQQPFTRGSYLIFGPGDLTTWGRRLPEPHGRIHFAGAEASALPSYMEGAVRAGERAAAEILG